MTVPASVPSLSHNSLPWSGSWPPKNSVPPTLIRPNGGELLVLGSMSLTRTVPASVPSLFHRAYPTVGSKAEKNKVPFTSVSTFGRDPVLPGLMS